MKTIQTTLIVIIIYVQKPGRIDICMYTVYPKVVYHQYCGFGLVDFDRIRYRMGYLVTNNYVYVPQIKRKLRFKFFFL